MKQEQDWWRGCSLYQIYPRSFKDTTGSGTGDLQGIIEKLPYIQSLGVDGVWVSPFFPSPMCDFGYDVSDYRGIDPLFGSIDDFQQLLDQAHELGLKVIIDQVWSHSSDQHEWFTQSRQSRDNTKADWYVWQDAKPDGTPPNNWLSVFGGSVWTWDTRRGQYYLHNFLTEQPDLNFHNPEVRAAVLDIAGFWLDMGVDGFRLDVCNLYYHNADLADNPPRSDGEIKHNPHDWQDHVHCRNQPETLEFLRELRKLLNQYEGRTLLGEIADENGLPELVQYTSGDEFLHSGYFFDFFLTPCVEKMHKNLARWQAEGEGWPTWALGNHDFPRVATRWGGANPDIVQLKLYAAMQVCLKGSVCIYQGEELGLTQSKIAFEDLQDPQGINMWPEEVSRDGCRTPMPWSKEAPQAGFSSNANTWLPVDPKHREMAVDVQEADDQSLLNYYRRLIQWRKNQPILLQGGMRLAQPHSQIIAFYRTDEDQKIFCVFNFSGKTAVLNFDHDIKDKAQPFDSPFNRDFQLSETQLSLPPWEAAVLKIS